MDSHLKANYEKYISSFQWKVLRNFFVDHNKLIDSERSCGDPESQYLCDTCGWCWPRNKIEVHHKHYRMKFGTEVRTDVEVLCHSCHKKADKIRAREGRKRSQAALVSAIYDSGFKTWINKRYGDDCIYYYDSDYEHELFEDFLERQREW